MRLRSIIQCVALLLAVACCAAAASLAAAGPAPLDPAPQAKWTVIVYMDGDNNLEPWITRDIDREMAATGSNADVQAEYRGFANAMAGCEDSTGYTGFEYGEILAKLQADPAMAAPALATVAARSIRTGHDKWSLTASAVTLGWRWDRLTAAVSDLGWDMAVGFPRYRRAYAVARRHSVSPPQSYSEVRDLYDAAREIRAHVGSSAIKKDCTRVMEALRRVVIYEWSPAAEGDLHGISFFWPAAPAPPHAGSSFSQWVNFPYYCTQLQFTRLTYWSDFLAAWGG